MTNPETLLAALVHAARVPVRKLSPCVLPYASIRYDKGSSAELSSFCAKAVNQVLRLLYTGRVESLDAASFAGIAPDARDVCYPCNSTVYPWMNDLASMPLCTGK